MTIFYIVRHGETAWNTDGRIQGHLDVELSKTGIRQARLAAERLGKEKLDAVYASDLKRATETGRIIASAHSLEVAATPLLREACLGKFQGLTTKEASENYPDEFAAYSADSIANRPPDAERLEDVITRCRGFLDEVSEKYPDGGHIGVAAHGGSVRGLIAAALGLGPELYRRVRIDNGSLTIIRITSGKPLLTLLNDTCHLKGRIIGDGVDL